MTIKSKPVYISSRETAEVILDKYDHFLFDCDGVIWLDEKLIPGVAAFLARLVELNKTFTFVSNNSSKSRDTYVTKFKRLGIPNIAKEQIYPTCYSSALELRKLGIEKGSKVWILGDLGIEEEVREMGYIPLGGTDPRLDTPFDPEHPLLKVDPEVKAVVVGSTKDFNYMRISLTLQYLLYNDKSIPFIGANIDRSFPGPGGMILPAGGSMVNYMSYTSHRTFINAGKPSREFLDIILEDCNFERSKTLMVGDTLYTDIKFGNDGKLGDGHGSLLVLSGGTKFTDLKKVIDEPHLFEEAETLMPLFYTESLGALIDLLE